MNKRTDYNYKKMKKKYDFCDKRSTCIKCVLVGDSGVGKSNVAARMSSRNFKEEYQPTLFDNYAATVFIDEKPFHFSLFDTAGKEDYDRLRVISYMNCDVFLVCFAIDDINSLKSVETNWVPELRRYLPKTPFILVGTRADRRDDNTGNKVDTNCQVSYKQAMALSSKVGAICYVECSSLSGDGIQDLIKETVETVVKTLDCSNKSRTCCSCSIL